ncbi:hypothetical protein PO909_024918 [Leuciscus waleckii]
MINDIFDDVGFGVGCALYADDGAIWKRGRNTKQVISGMQTAINKVEEWSIECSFKMSTSKSSYMIFSRKKEDFKDIKLLLYGKPLEQVKSFKYLGMWLDGRYTWNKHIEEIDKKCRRVLNVMRAIAGKEWGAERDSMITIYQALIRSTVDYGCMIYGSASESLLIKRHLYNIKKIVGKKCINGRNRKEEVIMTRMRLGHSRLNASLFIIGVHETGLCENCGEKETVEHVIYNCKRFDEERKELISYLNERGKVNKDLTYLLGYDFNRDRVGYRMLIEYIYTTGLSERI